MMPGKVEELAWKVESAIADYFGVDFFPAGEWPDIANLFAKAVEQAAVNRENVYETSQAAKELVETLGKLLEAMSGVVG